MKNGLSFQKALFCSLALHLLLVLFFCSQPFFPAPTPPIPKLLVVHAVRMGEKKSLPPTPAPKKQEKPIPSPPKEEIAPIETVASSEKEPPPEPAPEKKNPPAPSSKKEPPPRPQKKSSSVKKKETTASALPSHQKNQTSQKLSSDVVRNVQALIAHAQSQRAQSSSKETPSSVGHIASLSFEESSSEEETDWGMTLEEAYIATIVRLIQLSITLPDKEPVSVRLELFSSGIIKTLSILSSPSRRNKDILEKGLRSLRYPSFGKAYKGESSHSFLFSFTRQREWTAH